MYSTFYCRLSKTYIHSTFHTSAFKWKRAIWKPYSQNWLLGPCRTCFKSYCKYRCVRAHCLKVILDPRKLQHLHFWACSDALSFLFLNILFIYFQREGKGRRKRGWETSMCGWLSRSPHWRPGPHPRHVPWLGIKLVTLWFIGQHSIHWATPARAALSFLKVLLL